MPKLLQQMIHEDDGGLSFEWVLVFSLLVIGIVSGVTAARDAVVDEMGDSAEAMVALDQSYAIDAPLMPAVIDPSLGMTADPGGGTSSGFSDFATAYDCTRGQNAPQGQAAMIDEN